MTSSNVLKMTCEGKRKEVGIQEKAEHPLTTGSRVP